MILNSRIKICGILPAQQVRDTITFFLTQINNGIFDSGDVRRLAANFFAYQG
jgi:hypothetical protein